MVSYTVGYYYGNIRYYPCYLLLVLVYSYATASATALRNTELYAQQHNSHSIAVIKYYYCCCVPGPQ